MYADNKSWPQTWRGSASYVTGAHNVKIGYQGSYLANQTNRLRNPTLMAYRFNQGVPNQFTMALDQWQTADRTQVAALFGQDSWTHGRFTIQGALRYDRAWSYSPGEHNGTTQTSKINPSPITFDKTYSVHTFNDITFRMGVVYDVFGNGKTALKFNFGRLSGVRDQRRPLHGEQPSGPLRQHGEPDVDGYEQQQGRRLQPAGLQRAVGD